MDTQENTGPDPTVPDRETPPAWTTPPPAWWVALGVLAAWAVVTRFVGLGDKPLHHDESLFAYYGYWLGQGSGYTYMPILHGPILQWTSAAFFMLFGDNEFTMRLPAALGGLAMFAAPWGFRRRLGPWGLMAAWALLAVSPSITFYSRFLRNDVPYLAVTGLCALALTRALARGPGSAGRALPAWGAILSALAMFCMMESSIFFFVACLGFLAVAVAVDGWRGRTAPAAGATGGTRFFGWGTATAAGLCVALGAAWLYLRIFADTLPIHKLPLAAGTAAARHQGALAAAWGLLAALAAGGLAVVLSSKSPARAARVGVAGALSALVGVTLLLALSPLARLAASDPLGAQSAARFVWFAAAWAVAAVLVRMSAAELEAPGPQGRGRDGLARRFLATAVALRWHVAAALAVSLFLYSFLFTTAFTNVEAAPFDHTPDVRDFRGDPVALTPVQIYKNTWDYWWDQHKQHRIKGPFHYYLPILLLYELPAIMLALWGGWRTLTEDRRTGRRHLLAAAAPQAALAAVLAVTKVDWEWMDRVTHLTHPFHLHLALFYVQCQTHLTGLLVARGRRVEAFVTFWCATQIFAYSYAGEKVPWLAIHTAGPLLLLAGFAVARMAAAGCFSGRLRRTAWGAAAALALLWQVRAQAFVAWVHPHSPAERIVYNHTTPDIPYLVERIRQIGHMTGEGRDLPVLILGEANWPMYWYARRMSNTSAPAGEDETNTSRTVIIMDWDKAKDSARLREFYVVERLKLREWWEPNMLDLRALSDGWRFLTPRESRRVGDNADRWRACQAEWRRLWRYVVYREVWLDPATGDWSNSANEIAFCVRKDEAGSPPEMDRLSRLKMRPDIRRQPTP